MVKNLVAIWPILLNTSGWIMDGGDGDASGITGSDSVDHSARFTEQGKTTTELQKDSRDMLPTFMLLLDKEL